MLKTFTRFAGAGLVLGALGTIPASAFAELTFLPSGSGLLDTGTSLYWDSFATEAAGAAAGYRLATAAETSVLFDDRVAGLSTFVNAATYPYTPGSGSYNIGWGTSYTAPGYATSNILWALTDPAPACGSPCPGGPGTGSSRTLVAAIDAGDGSFASVKFDTYSTGTQYGITHSEKGVIQTAVSGAPASYLMVKGVPEPSTYALVGIGLAAAAAVARRRGQG